MLGKPLTFAAFGLLLATSLCVGLAQDVPPLPPIPTGNREAEPKPTTAPSEANYILDTRRTFWRFRTVRETEEVVLTPQDSPKHLRFIYDRNFFYKNKEAVVADKFTTTQPEVIRLPADTPADWMTPAFDDSTWVRAHGPMLDGSIDSDWKLILMRGQFEVADPAKGGDLKLSLAFRGGCVVYVNGQEVARAFMPDGPIDNNTCALPYPLDVYVTEDGYVMHRREKDQDERLAKRIHKLTDVAIPAARLCKGINTLAISFHRAPTDARFYLGRTRGSQQCNPPHQDTRWCKVGLLDVSLIGPPQSSAVANVARPTGKGFVVWNDSIIRKVYVADYPDPFATLQPVRLTGVRNGTFAGQVVAGDEKPIKGLRATAGDLAGPGVIPAANVQFRYAVPGISGSEVAQSGTFDSLEDVPPAEVPVYQEAQAAVQPIWISVKVPADAKGGDYAGKLTISADGAQPVTVPLELHVADWTLNDPKDFLARMDIVESPESLAMAYDVPLWSDAHFKLLDKTFSLLGPLAAKTLYVTCIRRTHFGNEHAMVRWTRDAEGSLQPDFSIAEKYLDLAIRHLGKVPGVILYCWEPTESMGHAGGAGSAGRSTDKPILYTLVDKEGKMRPLTGPAWGTPEAQEFWRKLSAGMKKVLDARGMGDSMLFGLVGDARPTKQAMGDITFGVEKPKWAVHSHYYCVSWQGFDMGFSIALWGIGCHAVDPSQGYGYGWRNAFWLNYYPREMALNSSLVEYRTKLENWLGARTVSQAVYTKAQGARGLGRLGADFWVVVKNEKGRRNASLAGRYPESYWGQLNLNYGVPYVLGWGRQGPVATVRSEAFRENIQETEARIFIEKALLDPALKARLGDDLAGRCRAAIDERIRLCMNADGEGLAWFVSSGWSKRTERLFGLAAEVAGKLK